MNSIDLKSLMIGILSCALVFMLMGLSEGSNQKYQIFCGASLGTCSLLNTETGISKIILPKHLGERTKEQGFFIQYGEKPDF